MAGGSTIGKLVVDLFLEDKGFKAGLKGAEAQVKQAGATMGRFAQALEGAVVTGFKAATAAAAAFVAATAVVGATFEQEIARIAAATGVSGAELEALTQKARQLGRETLFTATEAAGAIGTLAKAGLSVSDAMTAADAALVLAGTQGDSIEDVAFLIVSAMKQFGLAADQTGRIADVFAMAADKSTLDLTSLAEAMKFAGLAGNAFGMSLEETAAAVAALRDLGLEGSQAGTIFRAAMVAAAQDTNESREALRRYHLTLADINPETHTFAEIIKTVGEAMIGPTDAMKIFGKIAGPAVASLAEAAREGRTDLDALTEALMRSAGTVKTKYEVMLQSVQSQGKLVVSAFQDLLIETFTTYGKPLAELLGSLGGLFNELSAAMKAQASTIKAALADSLGRMTQYVKENGPALAQGFVNAAKAAAKLMGVVVKLIPYLDDIARLMVSIFAGVMVARFAQQLALLPKAFKAISAALNGTATAAQASAVALGAIGVAFAALTGILLAFEKRTAAIEARAMAGPAQQLRQYTADLAQVTAEYNKELESLRKAGYSAVSIERMLLGVQKATVPFTADNVERLRELADRREWLTRTVEQYTTRLEVEGRAQEQAAQAQAEAVEQQRLAEEQLRALMSEIQGTTAATEELTDADKELIEEYRTLLGLLSVPLPADVSGIEAYQDALFELLETVGNLDIANRAAAEGPDPVPEGFVSSDAVKRLRQAEAALEAIVGAPALSRADQLRQAIAGLAYEEAMALTEGSLAAAEAFADLRVQAEAALRSDRVQRFADALRSAARAAAEAAGEVGSLVSDIFSGLTGGQITVRGLIETATSGDEAGTTAAAQALIRGAADFARALAANIPDVLDVVIAELPRLIGVLVAAIPRLVKTLAAAVPDLFSLVVEQAPRLVMAIVKNVPDLVIAIVRNLPMLIRGILVALPALVTALVDELPAVIDAIIEAVPEIVVALLRALPDLIEALVRAVPVIVVAVVRSLVEDLIPQLPRIAVELVAAIVASLAGLVSGLIDGLADGLPRLADAFLGRVADWLAGAFEAIKRFFRDVVREIYTLGTAETATFGDTPGPVLAGAGGLTASFAPGDYVLASRSIEGLLRQLVGAVGAAPTVPGGSSVSTSVNIGGRQIARAVVDSAGRGESPAMAGAIRAGQGVKVGFSRSAGRRR